tara:strand:+ start:41 stop:151 length:111 start_codon:yes stop_codon:yes gene_type:complete
MALQVLLRVDLQVLVSLLGLDLAFDEAELTQLLWRK